MTSTTVPAEILTAGEHLWRAQTPAPAGSEVIVHAQGRFRRARVFKNGPKRAHVEYATSGTARRTASRPHGELYTTTQPEAYADAERYAVVRQHGTTGGRLGGHYLEGGEDL